MLRNFGAKWTHPRAVESLSGAKMLDYSEQKELRTIDAYLCKIEILLCISQQDIHRQIFLLKPLISLTREEVGYVLSLLEENIQQLSKSPDHYRQK